MATATGTEERQAKSNILLRLRPSAPQPQRAELVERLLQLREQKRQSHEDAAPKIAEAKKRLATAQAAYESALADFVKVSGDASRKQLALTAQIDGTETVLRQCAPAEIGEFIVALSREIDETRESLTVNVRESQDFITKQTKVSATTNAPKVEARIAQLRSAVAKAEALTLADVPNITEALGDILKEIN